MPQLLEPAQIREEEFRSFTDEIVANGEKFVPYSIDQKDMDFASYIQSLINESRGENTPDGWVPASTYFLGDDNGHILGAVSIRHRLTDKLRIEGGHIGFGIRPSARKQGYGSTILALALEIVKGMGIEKALITCDHDNIGSAKVIQNNGGVFDSAVEYEGILTHRYWISIPS